jgi:hypothetical protein
LLLLAAGDETHGAAATWLATLQQHAAGCEPGLHSTVQPIAAVAGAAETMVLLLLICAAAAVAASCRW